MFVLIMNAAITVLVDNIAILIQDVIYGHNFMYIINTSRVHQLF